MWRQGDKRLVEEGDILKNNDRNAACSTRMYSSVTVLDWFTGAQAGTSTRIDTDDLNDELSTETWRVIAEPSDDRRRTLSLFNAFVRVMPERPVHTSSEASVTSLAPSERRPLYKLKWCDDSGQLSDTGLAIAKYYRRLDDAAVLESPADRIDDIGVGGFVKRATRYDKPIVLDLLLHYLDAAPYNGDLTAYQSTEAYIDFSGDSESAGAFLRELQGLGFAAKFRKDERFDVGADPSRLTVDISVLPSPLK